MIRNVPYFVALCVTLLIGSSSAQNTMNTTLPTQLTMTDAERIAFTRNPNISIARLLELAAKQTVRETRSAELPAVVANVTAVDARDGSRITAGVLNNPSLYTRAAAGLTLSQLVTDFGRTRNLERNSASLENAQAETRRATEAEIVLAVDRAYLEALIQQQELKIADETVAARQATADEIEALTRAKLKSTLDLSFANVQLSQAQMQELDAKTRARQSLAILVELLGSEDGEEVTLTEENDALSLPESRTVDALVAAAFSARPDLAAQNDKYRAASQFSAAEHDLSRPTISALAAAGNAPFRDKDITDAWYGAVGVNVSIPVFNGFLFSARAREAALQADAAQLAVDRLRERIARDVRTTWLGEQNAYQRIAVAHQLLEQSQLALQLAETRYKLGLAGIVELSQAQLGFTEAEINDANARTSYRMWTAEMRYQLGK